MTQSHPKLDFATYFKTATGQQPFPFQCAFAGATSAGPHEPEPALVSVPTGLGKTAMAILGWLWRRRFASEQTRQATPRRLVYCLPMRVLVEQTRDNASKWLDNLGLSVASGTLQVPAAHHPSQTQPPRPLSPDAIAVHVLMGGEDEPEWDTHPERDAIIIGTQDMLLSRALNRGYAASRARWPMHFGLLNTDCLWIFDEVQLMGSGLATTAQLEAFRQSLSPQGGNGCRSVWMSATLRPDWLKTVDFKGRIDDHGRIDGKITLSLSDADHKNEQVAARWNGKKPLAKADSTMEEKTAAALAAEVRSAHKPATRTLVVVNTVKRACELYQKIAPRAQSGKPARGKGAKAAKPVEDGPALPNLVLLHSRFRPDDRKKAVDAAFAAPTPEGTIIISTQVIEAGADVSATTLFTELAPWASLVQRFGRCNRMGEANTDAEVRWIDLPAEDAKAEKLRFPYELPALRAAAAQLTKLNDVGLGSLATHSATLNDDEVKSLFPYAHPHVIRRKDLIDLFDTTPDLAGNDIDIDRYVREIDETDVRLFWRSWDGALPTDDEPPPTRAELCPAPIGDFKKFAAKDTTKGKVFRRDFLEGKWLPLDAARIAPGQVYMVHADAGGYDTQHGWHDGSTARVEPLSAQAKQTDPDAYDDDGLSRTSRWQTIAQHTDDVCRELDAILKRMRMNDHETAALQVAARYHDWGKAHPVFQDAVKAESRPADMAASRFVAKAPRSRRNQAGTVADPGFWTRYARKHFRHELASALALLQKTVPFANTDRDLAAYLIAAHHGKVRLSIRSMPNEPKPRTAAGLPQQRFARGIWDGDTLPATDLGGGVTAPAVTLSLEPMELGLCEAPPFVGADGVGEPSWIERVLRLRSAIGPFRLAYLEALLRAADERASAGGWGGVSGAGAAASGKGVTNG
ncbi:MAG: type I-G CRISPR-associated helicase/endonuclease Cas3g [Phycisphaerales bacterium]